MHLNWDLEIGDNFYEELFVSTRKWSIMRNSTAFDKNQYARRYLPNFEFMRRDNQMAFLKGKRK